MSNSIALDNVPKQPGCYLWKDKFGKIIYVGKAKSLKTRMQQYFLPSNDIRLSKLVSSIDSFDYIITKSEKDALILERNLIKEHKPHFNILLTDDKRYPYIKLKLLENDLKIQIAREVKKDGYLYFGPFPNGYGTRKLFNLLLRMSKYKDGLPYRNAKDTTHWKDSYELCKKILSNNNRSIVKDLNQKMEEASENTNYELAQEIKETIKAIEFYSEKSAVQVNSKDCFDAIGISNVDGYGAISILSYRYGALLSKYEKVFPLINNDISVIETILFNYYSVNLNPDFIYLEDKFADLSFTKSIEIIFPSKGQKREILDTAIQNSKDVINNKLKTYILKEERLSENLDELKESLNLKSVEDIALIDNSNLNNTNVVSAIVWFKNGRKFPKNYLKFNLGDSFNRNADVEYMKLSMEKFVNSSSFKKPDLLIVDGSTAQLREVQRVLEDANLDINTAALVKDEFHRTRNLIDSDLLLVTSISDNLFNFLSMMQTEVDRFARSHQKNRRIKSSLVGTLEQINGIGSKTIEKLLSHFGDYSSIYNASIEELQKIVSKEIALKIKEKYND